MLPDSRGCRRPCGRSRSPRKGSTSQGFGTAFPAWRASADLAQCVLRRKTRGGDEQRAIATYSRCGATQSCSYEDLAWPSWQNFDVEVLMSKPKSITISTLAEFAKNTEQLVEKTIVAGGTFQGHWYRGVGSVAHELAPSLFRHPTHTDIEDLIKVEAKMLEDFRRQAVLMPNELSGLDDDNDLRTLVYMQHYGVPTRLLDWTNNPFIALYFALTSARVDASGAFSNDAAIWVLNPVKWNSVALSHASHGDSGALSSRNAVKGYGPKKLFVGDQLEPNALKSLNEQCACCLGIANNARMFAQRGVFTVFGRDTSPMERQFEKFKHPPESLIKFVIPKDKIGSLLTLLLHLGYTDSVAYPDMHGLAMEIKRLRGFRM